MTSDDEEINAIIREIQELKISTSRRDFKVLYFADDGIYFVVVTSHTLQLTQLYYFKLKQCWKYFVKTMLP